MAPSDAHDMGKPSGPFKGKRRASEGLQGTIALDKRVAVITPAFRAARWLGEAVKSVTAQTHAEWEHWIIADDGDDYETLLKSQGLADPRQRFLSTGRIGAGASRARNLALDRIDTPYVAILDADDRLKPEKLARAVAALGDHPIVSTALDVMTDAYEHLRFVGDGPDQVLTPGRYKFTALSMDSMIAWDRRVTDARYDLDLTNMTDLELLMQLWQTADRVYHLGTPLHDYVKVSSSMSNAEGVTDRMIASKRTLLARIEGGHYRFAAPDAAEGLAGFLGISLAAEAAYPIERQTRPDLLFEDNLEPLLRRFEAHQKPS